jgi:chromate transporter
VATEPALSLRSLFLLFLKVGVSYGAGTGMAAVLQDDLVRRRHAMERGEFMALYGLARVVPSGSMTALAVAVAYRFQRYAGTIVALLAMILPGFVLTVLLTVAYTLLAGSTALRVVNTTLLPAALGIVAFSTYRLAREFLTPSLELCMAIVATISVLALGLNPSLVLISGGVIGALVLRPRGAR